MFGSLPLRTLERSVSFLKRAAWHSRRRGDFLSARRLNAALGDIVIEAFRNLVVAREAVGDALAIGLDLADQTRVITTGTNGGTGYFFVRPEELDSAIARFGREMARVEKLAADTERARKNAFIKSTIFKLDGDETDPWLRRLLFGQGRFAVFAADRAELQSFWVGYDPAKDQYAVFLKSDRQTFYLPVDEDRLDQAVRSSIQTIAISPFGDYEIDGLFRIAAEKFLALYLVALRSDHRLPE